MTLRRLTAICGIAMTITLVLGMLAVCRQVLFVRFQGLEREHVNEDLRRVVRILQSKVKELDIVANDYAAWDSTYEFMKNPNERYIRSELSTDTLTAMGIRFYVLLDPSGNIALIKSYNNIRRQPVPSLDVLSLFEVLQRNPRSEGKYRSSGVVQLSDGPAIVSMRPILRTGGKGTSRGTLVLVRMIDDKQLLEWSSIAHVQLTISPVQGPAATVFTGTQEQTTKILSENRLAANVLIRDIFGRPCIALGFLHNRDLWQQGVAGTRELLVWLGIIGTAFGLINLWLIEDFVILRIAKLTRLTHEIRGKAGLAARVDVHGKDEIALLGHQMNAMLDQIENAHYQLLATQERLKFEATHDHLTGVLNRASGLQHLERELKRSDRERSTVAVIIVDADHFKQVNDNYGHAAGDRVLQQITKTVSSQLRGFDVFARYGGEEFLIVAPNCGIEEGAALAKRILHRLEHTDIDIKGTVLRVTVSAGLTAGSFPLEASEAIVLADRALYRAKANGRNCVEVEPPLLFRPVALPAANNR